MEERRCYLQGSWRCHAHPQLRLHGKCGSIEWQRIESWYIKNWRMISFSTWWCSCNSGRHDYVRTGQKHQNQLVYMTSICQQPNSTTHMALPPRSHPYRTPSPKPLAGKEATTIRKTRFYNILARNEGTKSLRSISKSCGISEACGRKWKKQ